MQIKLYDVIVVSNPALLQPAAGWGNAAMPAQEKWKESLIQHIDNLLVFLHSGPDTEEVLYLLPLNTHRRKGGENRHQQSTKAFKTISCRTNVFWVSLSKWVFTDLFYI